MNCEAFHLATRRMLQDIIVVVQSLSPVRFFETPWTTASQAPLSSDTSQSLLRFMSMVSVMLSNYLILCCPLLFFFCPQSFPASGFFPCESALMHQVAKVLEPQLQPQSFQWIFRAVQKEINKRKERIIFKPGHLFGWVGGERMTRALPHRLPLLPLGDGEGPRGRWSHWWWAENSGIVD